MAEAKIHDENAMDDQSLQELGGMGFALAVQIVRDREEAADAVQDALHRLLKRRGLLDPDRGGPRAWFLKVVRNRCLDLLRKRSRRPVTSMEISEPLAAADQRPDVVAEKRELLELLKAELLDMSADQREMILLRDFHNLSYAELAEVLSIPVGTVMSRLHRARTELRIRMQRYG